MDGEVIRYTAINLFENEINDQTILYLFRCFENCVSFIVNIKTTFA